MEYVSNLVNPFYDIGGIKYSISLTGEFELLIKPGFVDTDGDQLSVSSSGTKFPVVFCGDRINPISNFRVVSASSPKVVLDKAHAVALPMALINSMDKIILSHSEKTVYRIKCSSPLPDNVNYVSMSSGFNSNYQYSFSASDDLTHATLICGSDYQTSVIRYVTEGKYLKTLHQLIAAW